MEQTNVLKLVTSHMLQQLGFKGVMSFTTCYFVYIT